MHGYRSDVSIARNNMGLEGSLFAFEMLSVQRPSDFPSVRDLPLESLRDWENVPAMVVTPRTKPFLMARMVRELRQSGGSPQSVGMTDEQAAQGDRLCAFELEFERARRELRPDAPSRLSCLYVAADDAEGRAYAQMMATAHGFVMHVEVPWAVRVARLDSHWLGADLVVPTLEHLAGYWSGEPMPGREPRWEWLVDGVIHCTKPEQLKLLRAYNLQMGDVIPAAAGMSMAAAEESAPA